jgi:hypothetical protein
MKGDYMFMRNAPICIPAKVRLVETRGYNVVISVVLPFLKPDVRVVAEIKDLA